nr:hypothetical protein [Tanacetum cinerariifolium]
MLPPKPVPVSQTENALRVRIRFMLPPKPVPVSQTENALRVRIRFSIDQFKEEETETIGEQTMEEYMARTLDGYSGSDNEDANEHIEKVLEVVDLFHIPNITQDQVMLLVFPMLLTRAASRWLRNEPACSIKTWENLKEIFLSKYYPPARTAKKIEEINNFQQDPDETLCQAWEQFKERLLRCPQHYLTDMQEPISFYKGLDVPTRQILDSKGAIPSMKAADAKKVIQDMADHSKKWHIRTSTRCRSTRTSDGLAAIQA